MILLISLSIQLTACETLKVNDVYVPTLPIFDPIPKDSSVEELKDFFEKEHRKSLIWFALFRDTNPNLKGMI